jgi:hypothetical protein
MAATNLVETHLKMKLTPVKKAADGTWTLQYQPSDFQDDMRSDSSTSHVVTSFHGLDVKSTQNGIVVVDTSKDIGMTEAKALKQAVYAKMLSGYFDLKPNGEVAKVDGDLPFMDFWNESLKFQVGFFDVTFPAESVAPGGAWNISRALKNLQGLKLGDAGLMETNVFTLKGSAGGGHTETITASMIVAAKDLTGSTESAGQNSSLDISEFNHDKNGTFEFDTAAGCMTRGTEDELVKTSMNALVQGHTVTVRMDVRNTTKFELQKE